MTRSSPLRVLMTLQQLAGDGPSRFALDLAEQLAELGAAVELFVYRPTGDSPLPLPDLSRTNSRVPITEGYPPGMLRRYWRPLLTSRILRATRRADVVVGAQEGGEGVAAGFLAAKALRRPAAIIVQNNAPASLALSGGWTVRVLNWAYPRFDRAICVSQGVASTTAAVGVDPGRVTVIPNAVDLERIRTLASERPPEWLPDEPFVVGMGALAERKGFDLLVQAHARVTSEGLPHRVVILGEGPERGALEALIARVGVADTFLLPGFLKNPYPVVSHASLFCMPSRFEGWPLALTEAVALGVPAIAADCVAGPREILDGGRYGELVEVDSVEELADALARHLKNPDVLAEKARAGWHAAEAFSVRTAARAYLEVLEELVS